MALTLIAGLTAKQGEVLTALGYLKGEYETPAASVCQIVAAIREGGSTKGWVGIDPEGMRGTLMGLMARGLVIRRETPRHARKAPRWLWAITDAGWNALMAHYDELGL